MFLIPSTILSISSRASSLAVTQIRGRRAGSYPFLPTTVRALHVYGEKGSVVYSLIHLITNVIYLVLYIYYTLAQFFYERSTGTTCLLACVKSTARDFAMGKNLIRADIRCSTASLMLCTKPTGLCDETSTSDVRSPSACCFYFLACVPTLNIFACTPPQGGGPTCWEKAVSSPGGSSARLMERRYRRRQVSTMRRGYKCVYLV